MTGEEAARAGAISEALEWTGTPFMHEARIKGVGCDCGEFLIGVYAACGLMPDHEPAHVPLQWHLHPDAPGFDPEMYVRQVKMFTHEIDKPLRGDLAMFWWGHAYSHGALVIDWPTKAIHCFPSGGVQLVDASIDPFLRRHLAKHPVRFFSPWGAP